MPALQEFHQRSRTARCAISTDKSDRSTRASPLTTLSLRSEVRSYFNYSIEKK
ncbi:MAG: hypothetical protein KME17_27885 [Cyanosarcina radialis HA8281-LM2]|nr:hypothetical protein [Cyanosarcina radialis HA8281-LM2]